MNSNNKLRVLLIAPDFFSGIGFMARHIADSATNIDYYFFSNADIKRYKREFLKLASSVDILHWLSNLSWVELPSDLDMHGFQAPSIAAIYHFDDGLTGDLEKKEIAKLVCASKCDEIHVIADEWKNFFQPKTNTPVFLAHPVLNSKKFIANRKINRPRTPIRIGVFGLFREIKNRKRLDVFLDALKILLKQGYKFELVVQGPLWKDLEKDFLNQGLQITNLGYMPSLLAMKSYQYIDLYVCTSDTEGGPLTVLEALASGVPVVSTPVGVAAEAIAHGGGILVQKNNPNEVAQAIAKIINNPSLYYQLSKEAILISENFTWEKVGIEYSIMYMSALEIKTLRESITHLANPKFQRSIQLIRDLRRESVSFKNVRFWEILSTFLR